MTAWKRVAVLLVTVLLLSGCWNRREVNEVAIVSAVALDRTSEGKVRMTVQVVDPRALAGETGQASRETAVTLVSAEGYLVMEALHEIDQLLPRQLGWEHNNAIVFSEELARRGLADVLDFFTRYYQSRLDQWILIAPGEAAAVLRQPVRLEPNTGVGLRRLYRNAWLGTAEAVPVRLFQFLVDLFEPSRSPIASAARVEDGSVRIGGAAVFRGDSLAGWLTEHETRGLMWLRGAIDHTVLKVPCVKTEGRGISVETLATTARQRTRWERGALPVVEFHVEVRGRLGGQMCRDDLSSDDALIQLEERTADEIRKEAEVVLQRLQKEIQADPFGVGELLRRSYPRHWPDWEPRWSEVFSALTIKPVIHVRISQTGTTIGKPLPRTQP